MKTNERTISGIVETRFGKDIISKLQEQFKGKKLNVIVVEDKVAILAPLTPRVLSDYTRMCMDKDASIDVASKMLIDTLWLGGDEEIRNDEEYFMSAMIEVQNLIELKKSLSGKL